MKTSHRAVSLVFLTSVLILSLSCCRKNALQHAVAPEKPTVTRLVLAAPGTAITCGDSVKLELQQSDTTVTIDSVSITDGRNTSPVFKGNPGTFYWKTKGSRVGQTTLRINVHYADSLEESHNISFVVLSDIVPKPYTYKVINKFPHDDQAYTQGLIYENGILYESTGLEGKSSLRIVNISTGKPEKMIPLEAQYFGEGIALFKDEIYQITYRSQVGFVYDKKTLNKIRSFDYQIGEGWGLTTDGKYLLMTDGSDQIFFIEPEYFTQVDKIEVFDNKGMIDSINELEYIHGKVLANVYGQTFIIIIDPATGKVLGKAELGDLMPEGFKGDYGHVLNGIAYNPVTGHLYVTGKDWPVLYEIKLEPSI
jgi:glutaminyl-peptide cyclotransferase